MSDTIERPITVSTNAEQTHADRAQPQGSYTGAHALADDEIREQIGRKAQYPMHVANTSAPDNTPEATKEARARAYAGEQGHKDLHTHLGDHPQWKETDIPFSTLGPELVSDNYISQVNKQN